MATTRTGKRAFLVEGGPDPCVEAAAVVAESVTVQNVNRVPLLLFLNDNHSTTRR